MSMLNPRIKLRAGVPYGGRYELNLPEKGMVGKGTTLDMLISKISSYRKANGIPMGLEFEREVEIAVCLQYPDECQDTSPLIPSNFVRLGWEDILHGTQNLTAFVSAGRPLVPEEESTRRANICLKCEFRSGFNKPCGGLCGTLKALVDSVVGGKTIPQDGSLEGLACRICKCSLKAIVRVPLEFQLPHLTDLQRAQYQNAKIQSGCWKVPTTI